MPVNLALLVQAVARLLEVGRTVLCLFIFCRGVYTLYTEVYYTTEIYQLLTELVIVVVSKAIYLKFYEWAEPVLEEFQNNVKLYNYNDLQSESSRKPSTSD